MILVNLTPVQAFDVGIHAALLSLQMYNRLQKRTTIAFLKACFLQLSQEEREIRWTLRAHRRDLFGSQEESLSRDEVGEHFIYLKVGKLEDKQALIRAITEAIRFKGAVAHFYERYADSIPSREARKFFQIIAASGAYHAATLAEQITLLQPLFLVAGPRRRLIEWEGQTRPSPRLIRE